MTTLPPARTDLINKEIVLYGKPTLFGRPLIPYAIVTIASANKRSFKTTTGKTLLLSEILFSADPADIQKAKEHLHIVTAEARQRAEARRQLTENPHWQLADELIGWFGSQDPEKLMQQISLDDMQKIKQIARPESRQ